MTLRQFLPGSLGSRLQYIINSTYRAWGHFSPTSRQLEKEGRQQLAGVRTICLFIGNGRSGTSLIGHLLNQHPKAAIAHEHFLLDKLGTHGTGRIHWLLQQTLHKAQETQNNKVSSFGYLYRKLDIEPSSDGGILVLGDKSAAVTVEALIGHGFDILQGLEATGKNLKFMFVIRNPYDVISTLLLRRVFYVSPLSQRKIPIPSVEIADKLNADPQYRAQLIQTLPQHISEFFRRVQIVQALIDQRRWPLLPVHYREFTTAPREQLQKLLEFLELEKSPDYLDAAVEQVRPASRSRDLVDHIWDDNARAEVAKQMRRFDFLADYSFESD